MSNIKIKQFQLFKIEGNKINTEEINPALNALLSYKPEGAALRYDIQTRLSKAVDKALKEFGEQHKSLLEELSVKKKVKLKNNNEFETHLEIIEATDKNKTEELIIEIDEQKVKGKKIIGAVYDLGNKKEEFNKRFIDLLGVEIELDCYPLKLSRFDKEKNLPAEINFGALDDFIIDDLQ